MAAKPTMALSVLLDEIEAAIRDLDLPAPSTCQAHPKLARAVIALLRCQRAELQEAQRMYLMASAVSAVTAAVVVAMARAVPMLLSMN